MIGWPQRAAWAMTTGLIKQTSSKLQKAFKLNFLNNAVQNLLNLLAEYKLPLIKLNFKRATSRGPLYLFETSRTSLMVALKWLERHFEEPYMLHVPCSNSSLPYLHRWLRDICSKSHCTGRKRNSFDGDGMGCLHRRIIVCS